jgi:hypothetical protein
VIALLPRSVGLSALAFGFLALSGVPSSAQVRSAHVTVERDELSRARTLGAKAMAPRDLATGFSVVEAPFPFSAVAVLANPSSDGDLTVRVSADGREWSDPARVPDDAPNPPLNERGQAHRFALDRVSSLYFPGSGPHVPARFLAFEFVNARNPPARVTLHFIDAGASPERPARSRTSDSGHPLKPPLVSRAAWGARPPKYPYSLTLAKHLAIHHTAGVSDGVAATTEECAAQVRAIQAFHQDTRDWNDVGYSYLICGTGEVFQAREDDDDATDVWGAHDGFNRGSMSVSLMGYFHPPYDQAPSPPMLDSLVRTLAWMADLRSIDPLDESLYEAFGGVRTNIYGHREVRATECPGDTVFAMKDSLRIAVAATLEQYRNPIPPGVSRR